MWLRTGRLTAAISLRQSWQPLSLKIPMPRPPWLLRLFHRLMLHDLAQPFVKARFVHHHLSPFLRQLGAL